MCWVGSHHLWLHAQGCWCPRGGSACSAEGGAGGCGARRPLEPGMAGSNHISYQVALNAHCLSHQARRVMLGLERSPATLAPFTATYTMMDINNLFLIADLCEGQEHGCFEGAAVQGAQQRQEHGCSPRRVTDNGGGFGRFFLGGDGNAQKGAPCYRTRRGGKL